MRADEDPTRRYDYLFEPLVDAEPLDAVATTTPDREPPTRSRTVPIAVLAIIAASAAAVASTVVLFMRHTEADDVPVRPVTTSSSPAAPIATRPAEPAPSQPLPPSTAPETVQPPRSQPPARQPEPQRTSRPPAPVTRAPLSVRPEPRPAFPNQPPQRGNGNDSGGGLLPGLGGGIL